jgi:hypothetical protein
LGCEKSPPTSERPVEFTTFPKELSFASAGVSVYCQNNICWIENKGDYPVRIQRVQLYCGEDNCDRTKWIFPFLPGQIKKDSFSWGRTLFHIYDTEGKPLGFIYLEESKEKGET